MSRPLVAMVVRRAPDLLSFEDGQKLVDDYRANWFPRLGADPTVAWFYAHQDAEEVMVFVRVAPQCEPRCSMCRASMPGMCALHALADEKRKGPRLALVRP